MLGSQIFQCFFLGVKETVKACVGIEYPEHIEEIHDQSFIVTNN
jgi:hypothetical protein